jgi:hypothetical protein
MEQREGRVHRYKGHAVRKNVARAYGLAALVATDEEAGSRDGEVAEAVGAGGVADTAPIAEGAGAARVDATRGMVRAVAPDTDPWDLLFERARADRADEVNDLYPYWLFPLEAGARIERRVPMLPLSRERGRYQRLRRSLAVYRMVFGQPRQEDLLAHLRQRIRDEALLERLARQQIRLEPPEVA